MLFNRTQHSFGVTLDRTLFLGLHVKTFEEGGTVMQALGVIESVDWGHSPRNILMPQKGHFTEQPQVFVLHNSTAYYYHTNRHHTDLKKVPKL